MLLILSKSMQELESNLQCLLKSDLSSITIKKSFTFAVKSGNPLSPVPFLLALFKASSISLIFEP